MNKQNMYEQAQKALRRWFHPKSPPAQHLVAPSRKRPSAWSIHPMDRKQKADSLGLSAVNEAGEQCSPPSVPNNGRHKQEGVPIFNSKWNEIGRVVDGVFYKRVRGSEHMLRRPPAWANDVEILKQVERANGTLVVLDDTESGIRFSAPLSRIWERGREFNRGYGDQIFLVLAEWDKDECNSPTQNGNGATPPPTRTQQQKYTDEPVTFQLSMFEGAS